MVARNAQTFHNAKRCLSADHRRCYGLVLSFLFFSIELLIFKYTNMIREFFEDMPILSIGFVIFILSVAFIIVDGAASKSVPFYGIVVDKHYKAERNSTGTGYVITSNGKSGVIFTSQHEDEEFLLMVKTENEKVVTVECEPELYYKKEIGQRINCNAYKGYFTGLTWSLHGSF